MVGQEHVEVLKSARESFVRKRRIMAEQMVPAGAAASHFAPAFADLQAAIEALDRAIVDEGNLPEDYAPALDGEEVTPNDPDQTVVHVSFDPSHDPA
jgi:hypothetical protein